MRRQRASTRRRIVLRSCNIETFNKRTGFSTGVRVCRHLSACMFYVYIDHTNALTRTAYTAYTAYISLPLSDGVCAVRVAMHEARERSLLAAAAARE